MKGGQGAVIGEQHLLGEAVGFRDGVVPDAAPPVEAALEVGGDEGVLAIEVGVGTGRGDPGLREHRVRPGPRDSVAVDSVSAASSSRSLTAGPRACRVTMRLL